MSEFIVIGQRAEDGIAIDFSKPAVGELVRCKDCKNYEHIVTAVDNEGNITKECDFCNHWKRIIDVSDFCSYGERKDDE